MHYIPAFQKGYIQGKHLYGMERRQFLNRSALIVGAGLTKGPDLILPRAPEKSSHIKLSCNAYSFNDPLSEGEMSVEDMIDLCGSLPLDAVDLTGYYLGTYPDPPAADYLYALKKRAFRLGLAISGTGVRNDFTSTDASEREAAVSHVNTWVEVAARLDAPVLRVFTGRPLGDPDPNEQTLDRVADCLRNCAEYGSRHGVMIVLQNHDELLHSADETLDLLRRAEHPWLGLCLDIGSLRMNSDPYAEIARLAPHAVTWQIKEKVYRRDQPEDLDMARLVGIMRESGYRGYAPLEILNSDNPGDDLAKMARAFGKEIGR